MLISNRYTILKSSTQVSRQKSLAPTTGTLANKARVDLCKHPIATWRYYNQHPDLMIALAVFVSRRGIVVLVHNGQQKPSTTRYTSKPRENTRLMALQQAETRSTTPCVKNQRLHAHAHVLASTSSVLRSNVLQNDPYCYFSKQRVRRDPPRRHPNQSPAKLRTHGNPANLHFIRGSSARTER